MKLITRDTDYAIRSLLYLAKNTGGPVTVTELTKKLKMPSAFLRRILQILSRKGILKSYKGRGGGFLLGVSPQKIFVLNLIEIFQGPFKLIECIDLCIDIKNCPLRKKIMDIEQLVFSELEEVSIDKLKVLPNRIKKGK